MRNKKEIVALKKPSEFFGKSDSENNFPVVGRNDTLRQELSKVESLSEQINELQKELTQTIVKTDLEKLVISQINEMKDNFENLQNQIHQSNKTDIKKFKGIALNITETVNNLIENEIPQYRKQITSNEIRVSNQFETFKEKIEERVEKFYGVLKEFNTVVEVIESVTKVEEYIQQNHSELISLREEVFEEIKQIPLGNLEENLKRLEKKIDYIRDTYSSIDSESVARQIIQEGLLNEPPETKNEDPLTPLDQNFVTLDQLQEHYRLFINRIQQQLSTFSGGGETRLKYLDDIVGIATNASAYDGKFLTYNHTLGKFEFVTVTSSGGETYWATEGVGIYTGSSVGIGTTNPTSKLYVHGDGYYTGVVTAYSFAGNLTGTATTATNAGYASTAGISTVSQGLTGTPNINVGIVTSTISIPTQLRTRTVAEKTTIISGNTVGLAFSTGGGNVAICTNPSGDITLNVTDIPTDSSFDNHSISFSVVVNQTGTARTCTAVNLNGVSRTIKWAGGSISNAISGVTTSTGFDIFTFTGINTVGSASTTTNYVVLGSVNGGFN